MRLASIHRVKLMGMVLHKNLSTRSILQAKNPWINSAKVLCENGHPFPRWLLRLGFLGGRQPRISHLKW